MTGDVATTGTAAADVTQSAPERGESPVPGQDAEVTREATAPTRAIRNAGLIARTWKRMSSTALRRKLPGTEGGSRQAGSAGLTAGATALPLTPGLHGRDQPAMSC